MLLCCAVSYLSQIIIFISTIFIVIFLFLQFLFTCRIVGMLQEFDKSCLIIRIHFRILTRHLIKYCIFVLSPGFQRISLIIFKMPLID